MANSFQLHSKQATNGTFDLVPDGTTSIPNDAQVVIHALYISNDNEAAGTTVDITITDGSNQLKGYILKGVEIPQSSTISLERPINLPQSSTAAATRKLRITADNQLIYGTASVLVITW